MMPIPIPFYFVHNQFIIHHYMAFLLHTILHPLPI